MTACLKGTHCNIIIWPKSIQCYYFTSFIFLNCLRIHRFQQECVGFNRNVFSHLFIWNIIMSFIFWVIQWKWSLFCVNLMLFTILNFLCILFVKMLVTELKMCIIGKETRIDYNRNNYNYYIKLYTNPTEINILCLRSSVLNGLLLCVNISKYIF